MLRLLLLMASLALIGLLSAGFFGFAHPALDTAAHFRWHAGLALLVLALACQAIRLSSAAFILLAFAAIGIWQSGANNRTGSNAAGVAGAVEQAQEGQPGATRLSIVQFNMRFDNPRRADVITMLRESGADILMLSEASRLWQDSLRRLEDLYPHRFHCPEWSNIGGSMIFSRLPMRSERNYCHAYGAAGFTQVLAGGRWIETGVVHMRWPWPASGPEQLTALVPRLEAIGEDAIVAGDFNATTWSHAVESFARHGGLDIHRGFGGTWMYKHLPTGLAPVIGLPIDQVLSKGAVRLEAVRTLPAIGSDHLPIRADFIILPVVGETAEQGQAEGAGGQ